VLSSALCCRKGVNPPAGRAQSQSGQVLGTLCRCHRPPLSLVAVFTVLYCTYYSHSFFVVCCPRELVLSWTGQGRTGRQPATTAETHDLRFIPFGSWSHYHLGGRVEPWDEHKPARSAIYPMKHHESTGPQNSTAEAPGMYGSMLSSGMDPSSYCTFTERSLGLASPIPCSVPLHTPQAFPLGTFLSANDQSLHRSSDLVWTFC
jgi:hypothetical protein